MYLSPYNSSDNDFTAIFKKPSSELWTVYTWYATHARPDHPPSERTPKRSLAREATFISQETTSFTSPTKYTAISQALFPFFMFCCALFLKRVLFRLYFTLGQAKTMDSILHRPQTISQMKRTPSDFVFVRIISFLLALLPLLSSFFFFL